MSDAQNVKASYIINKIKFNNDGKCQRSQKNKNIIKFSKKRKCKKISNISSISNSSTRP